MKKYISFLIAVILLFSVCQTAFAAYEPEPFVFRNGIHWWMTTQEVLSLETAETPFKVSLQEGYPLIVYNKISVSKYDDAQLFYIFKDDSLIGSAYLIYNESEVDYLSSALIQRYGQNRILPSEKAVLMLNEVNFALTGEKMYSDANVDFSVLADTTWLLDDETMIIIISLDNQVILMYLAPDLYGKVNDNGL